ncbi:hypothetical protein M433DRAFT_368499 [Acidomyces richmondensis BFW]|nr:hypothetical protein M433DRAFT_368499 [Acidomyces richmondensis BFW]
MKYSAVVQGFKSFAAGLHPPLPLSPKESSRLLTALTSSFRQHLDEVHPPSAEDRTRHDDRSSPMTAKRHNHATHSSSALADRHLASVLTNPLLAKGTSGSKRVDTEYAMAETELQRDSSKDPLSLLEEYEERGAATVSIALLCLDSFQKSLYRLDHTAQQAAIDKCGAGRRALLWLWKGGHHMQPEWTDNSRFMELLVSLLMKEGHEEILWDWIGLDPETSNSHASSLNLQMPKSNRWKGLVVRCMIGESLRVCSRSKNADPALDIFFKASELKRYMMKIFTSAPSDYIATDPEQYEKFVRISTLELKGGTDCPSFEAARLWMAHPTKPTAEPALEWFWNASHPTAPHAKQAATFFNASSSTTTGIMRLFNTMVRAAALLRLDGRVQDAAWLKALAGEKFPDTAKDFEFHVGMLQSQERDKPRQDTCEAATRSTFDGIPFPTLT